MATSKGTNGGLNTILNRGLMDYLKWVKIILGKTEDTMIMGDTEWSKSEREKQIPYANTYIWNLKKKKKWSWRT